MRHLVRAIVSSGPEVVEFKGRAQLGDLRRNETKGLILSQGPSTPLAPESNAPDTRDAGTEPGDPTDQETFPILNIVVPHSLHLPRVAGRPFFIVTGCALWISRLSRHFRQYPVIESSLSSLKCPTHAVTLLPSGQGNRSIVHGLGYFAA